MSFKIGRDSVLIVVDVQKDFCPGGALPVPYGDRVVPVLNKYIQRFKKAGGLIYATRDWHPPNHTSFKPRGGPWPTHCVQNTVGTEFHGDLKLSREVKILSKATDPEREAYSGFDGTGLGEELRRRGVRRVFVGGLATDYCVKSTVLDALKLGFETVLLEDAIRGVDVRAGDSGRAVEDMVAKGARRATLSEVG